LFFFVQEEDGIRGPAGVVTGFQTCALRFFYVENLSSVSFSLAWNLATLTLAFSYLFFFDILNI
ncbi:hypothetical protein, partial [Okeania sp. SIO3B5]|uniref:hypothetical protein n=1 Tax=Okeania sp. SIO3B5 TaxID=2607811 RepID=UPI0025D2C9A2